MKTLFTSAFVLLLLSASAQSDSARISSLEKKIDSLETRMLYMERMVYKDMSMRMTKDSNVVRLQHMAKERARKDYSEYSKKEVMEAEALYQEASRRLGSERGRELLREVISKYPKMNRAGCAALYLAKEMEGHEREDLLRQAFEKYGDCMYYDGVQVGAYARYILADIYNQEGNVEGARELMQYVNEHFPHAIDHEGKRLVLDIHD